MSSCGLRVLLVLCAPVQFVLVVLEVLAVPVAVDTVDSRYSQHTTDLLHLALALVVSLTRCRLLSCSL